MHIGEPLLHIHTITKTTLFLVIYSEFLAIPSDSATQICEHVQHFLNDDGSSRISIEVVVILTGLLSSSVVLRRNC